MAGGLASTPAVVWTLEKRHLESLSGAEEEA